MFQKQDRLRFPPTWASRTSTNSARCWIRWQSSGKLGALLAQFPTEFQERAAHPRPTSNGSWRHSRTTWSRSSSDTAAGATSRPSTIEILNAVGAAWAQIDEPKFRTSIHQSLLPAVRTFYYLRLHGRNAKQWWKHDKSEDRYNYLYSAEELEPFAEAVETASRQVRKAYLYANNHFSAKSVANAAILKHQLGQTVPGEYPQAFVDAYPDLKTIVKVLQPPLIPSPKPS